MADSDDDESGERVAFCMPVAAPGGAEDPLVPPREFVAAQRDLAALGALANLEKISVLSYNVLSQMGARRLQRGDMAYVSSALLTTLQRRERLRREILSYDADVLCLQELDDYDDYWANELTANGYDSVFAMHATKRAKNARRGGSGVEIDHGLVIAFKRELFQVFRTQEIDLNDVVPAVTDANLAVKCEQDNIALCVQLQPWETSRLPSAVCVVTTQLVSGHGTAMDHVRVLQTEFLCREVAQLNAVSNLPIILAGTFNALPSSDVYHVISTGRRRPRPSTPHEMDRPVPVDITPTSVRLTWTPPDTGDAPIEGYKIAVKNCTSATLGFSMHEIEIDGGSDVDSNPITMLSGGVTYQFRVAARNQYGYGPFSQPSLPVTTLQSVKLQITNESKTQNSAGSEDEGEDDGLELPLYIVDDAPPQVKPYAASFGSGRTPRFESGEHNMQVSPRKLLLRGGDAKANQYVTLHARADRDAALVQCEQFESAYAASQGAISEPEFTYASARCIGTIDYIFYSATQFEPFQLLEMPTLEDLEALGVDVRQPHLTPDAEWAKHRPSDWRDSLGVTRNDEDVYMGEWITPQLRNTFARSNPWLPNRVYPSDHLALACVLAMKKENVAVEWN